MPTVTMPQLGESVAEGTIGKWLKQVGDHVDKYEPIVEVVTDKVNAEVPSPVRGHAHRDPRGRRARRSPTTPRSRSSRRPGRAADRPRQPRSGAGPAPQARRRPAAARPQRRGAGPRPRRPRLPAASARAAAVPWPPPPRPRRGTGAAPSPAYAGPHDARGPAPGARARRRPARWCRHRPRRPRHPRRRPRVRRVAGGNGAAAASAPSAPAAPPAARPSAAPPSPPPPPGRPGDSLKPLSPDAQGHRRPDDPRARACPVAYTTVEVDMSAVVALREATKRAYQEREGSQPVLRRVRDQGRGRGAAPASRTSTPTGPTRATGSAQAINIGIAVAVDDGLIVPVIQDADHAQHPRPQPAINDLADTRPHRQAPPRRHQRRHVHGRQHRLDRLDPDACPSSTCPRSPS